MVVKSQIKLIKSLQQKKYRNQHSLFVMEGVKSVHELLKSNIVAHQIYATDISLFPGREKSVELITEKELRQMSNLKSPNKVLGVFQIPKPVPLDFASLPVGQARWVVALDAISDPGNLGTIIRLCDWFGIRHLLCSKNTVDCYNPKVLQATMGSIARMNIFYDDLIQVLKDSKVPIYGTFLGGKEIYGQKLTDSGILVMGNEANGISEEIGKLCNERVSIPHFGNSATESLNVATATAIFLSEIRRKETTRK